jgi:hypothetical protein
VITVLCGPDDPCIPQGFRVLALDFDLGVIAISGENFATSPSLLSVPLDFSLVKCKRWFSV